MKQYEVYNSKTKKVNRYSYIGCNHTAYGFVFRDFISSYGQMLDNEDMVAIEVRMKDHRFIKLGNIKEAYEILNEIIKERKPSTFSDICECVAETNNFYFGNYSNIKNRNSFFPTEYEIDFKNKKRGTLSDIAHKNAAMCAERAMLSQNLLISLNIKSNIKLAGFINTEGKRDVHAFNLVENDGKYYIFDATQPTLKKDRINPLVAEIPEKIYKKLISPISDCGISVHVKHYNPLMKKEYDVIYDAGRKEQYDTCKKVNKHKRW